MAVTLWNLSMSYIEELQMKPEINSKHLLSVTQAKGKMFEYSVSIEDHIHLPKDPANLFPLTISLLGDLAAELNSLDNNQENIDKLSKELMFSAHFFDAYIQSQINQTLDPYFLMLGSASYYLCNHPGSSHVLSSKVQISNINSDASGIDILLIWLLKSNYNHLPNLPESQYSDSLVKLAEKIKDFFSFGNILPEINVVMQSLRGKIYLH